MKCLIYLLFSFFLIFGFASYLDAEEMNDYCQLPPSIGAPADPNVLLVIDTSGSMGWCAYTSVTGGGSCEPTPTTYNPTTTYEGYFDPTKSYVQDADGVWIETTPTGSPCVRTCTNWECRNRSLGDCDKKGTHGCSPSKYACCTSWQSSGDCGVNSGNYLNYKYMRRVDVLRWALTGGKPQSCKNSIQTCDPEVYPDGQLSCNINDGCILIGTDGSTKVKVQWDRITGNNGGLLFQLKDLSPKPLMGAMFFDTNGVNRTVYIGDFVASASYDGVNPYKNVITAINYEPPGGGTPTAPAMWDALNYLAQRDAQYGGPQPQTGSGNEWKNPMYRCFDKNQDGNCQGNEFELVPCAKNFMILLTDGQWNTGGLPVYANSCKIDNDQESESPDPVVPAYWMHKKGYQNIPTGIQSYVESVYAVGLWLGGTGEQALKNVAMYGAFDRTNQWPGGTSGYPQQSCGPVVDCCNSSNCAKGSTCTPIPSPSHSDWDKNGDGIPDTFYKAEDAIEIKVKMVEIILDMFRHVSSGTAASILASSEGSGANLVQAVYYPKRLVGDAEIEWSGEMQNLWYYIDPYLQNSTIREDTASSRVLNLTDDYIVQFYFDQETNETMANRSNDPDGDGTANSLIDSVPFENIKSLWRAGRLLWERDLSTSPRTIYTTINGRSLLDFSTATKSTLRPYLHAADDTEAERVINYINGIDQADCRKRRVTIGPTTSVWRLGDIISSTPRQQSSIPLNTYHLSPPNGYIDATYSQFIKSDAYLNRGMVYAGANDGMLHAFTLGRLEQSWQGQGSYEKARITGGDIGTEAWAYIPSQALPYLKYLLEEAYCHLYYVDLPPLIVDASINGAAGDTKQESGWRTVLISGMGLGGATKKVGASCTGGGTDCVKTPITDPSDANKGFGYSAYFALDVTDPNNPSLMWEFSHPELGFSTSGPAVVRVGEGSMDKNGTWYVVFASGPTGPITTSTHQFMGRSDQNLKLFVLDLKTGTLVKTFDLGSDLNLPNSFGGSLYNASLDTDRWAITSSGRYSDDIIYLGYTKKDTSTDTWTKGGVIRIVTKDSADPNDWTISKVIDDIGPVTAAVTKLQDRKNKTLWLYFGTGRFFYKTATEVDDAQGQRAIYGIKDGCYSITDDIASGCSVSTLSEGDLLNQTTTINPLTAASKGWYINLDPAERVITDPLAVFKGAVFFTTYLPSLDVCSYGGDTYIWAVRYDTGDAVNLEGKALIQVSTGEIKELGLSSAFQGKGGRRTAAISGMPPKGQGLSVLIGPKPIRKIIHIQER